MADTELIGEPSRCLCNKLLFTRTDDLVIIKCSRCKRYMVVQTHGVESVTTYDLNGAGEEAVPEKFSELDDLADDQ